MDQRPKHKTQFSSVAQSCPTLCDLMACSTPAFPVHYQLPVQNQNIRLENIKLLEKNIGGSNLLNAGLGDDFLNLIPKINKSKIKQVGLRQTKTFLHMGWEVQEGGDIGIPMADSC